MRCMFAMPFILWGRENKRILSLILLVVIFLLDRSISYYLEAYYLYLSINQYDVKN
jgi:hypothetical protein